MKLFSCLQFLRATIITLNTAHCSETGLARSILLGDLREARKPSTKAFSPLFQACGTLGISSIKVSTKTFHVIRPQWTFLDHLFAFSRGAVNKTKKLEPRGKLLHFTCASDMFPQRSDFGSSCKLFSLHNFTKCIPL